MLPVIGYAWLCVAVQLLCIADATELLDRKGIVKNVAGTAGVSPAGIGTTFPSI